MPLREICLSPEVARLLPRHQQLADPIERESNRQHYYSNHQDGWFVIPFFLLFFLWGLCIRFDTRACTHCSVDSAIRKTRLKRIIPCPCVSAIIGPGDAALDSAFLRTYTSAHPSPKHPLLLSTVPARKQVCVWRTGSSPFHRSLHSCLASCVRDVRPFAICQKIADGRFRLDAQSFSPWVDGLNELINLLYLFQFFCTQPHQHDILKCVRWVSLW